MPFYYDVLLKERISTDTIDSRDFTEPYNGLVAISFSMSYLVCIVRKKLLKRLPQD